MAEYRKVQIAPGHVVAARRARGAASREGKVLLIITSHRPPIEVDEARWNSAEIRRG